jgi:hydroxyacylglutathione hydrolase
MLQACFASVSVELAQTERTGAKESWKAPAIPIAGANARRLMAQVIPLRLKISNAFLVKGQTLALVDTGSRNETKAILSTITKAGLDAKDLSLILHTHAHMDHCGCSADLKKATSALLAIHRSDAQVFAEGKNAAIVPVNLSAKILTLFSKKGYPPATADIVLGDAMDLHPYGIDGRVISTPGHTPGSVSVLLDSGEAIVGDLIGGGRLLGLLQPDQPRFHYWYTDMEAAKESLSKVFRHTPTQIFVGHGGPLDGKTAARYFHFHIRQQGTALV